MSFVIKRSSNNQYLWLIKAANGQTLATSETYHNKADALSAVNSVKLNAAGARIVDET